MSFSLDLKYNDDLYKLEWTRGLYQLFGHKQMMKTEKLYCQVKQVRLPSQFITYK